MNWSDVFPILTDELIDEYAARATRSFKREAAGWFAEQRTVNPRPVQHIVSVSLFWKNIRSTQPEIVIRDRAWFMNAGRRKLLRFEPWTHYVKPLLEGAYALQGSGREDVAFRVYLAADLEFLIPDLVEAGCEVRLMQSKSLRHNPGAMWRFLALAETDRLITVVDADRAAHPFPDILRTERMAEAGLCWWRVPTWGELNEMGTVSYRPFLALQFGTTGGLAEVKLMMQALVWACQEKKIETFAKLPNFVPVEVHGTVWPDYGFDEWFMLSAVYPRAAYDGLLSFVPSDAKSRLLPLDIQYATKANPRSELVFFGNTAAGCCGTEPSQGVNGADGMVEHGGGGFSGMDPFMAVHRWAGRLQETRREKALGRKHTEKRFLAVCIPCGSRLAHLKQTLPGTLEVLRTTGQGVTVLMEYACREKSGEWARRTYAEDIAAGHLVVGKVMGVKRFQAGRAKAAAHALGCAYADFLLNLDADNFFTASDLAALSRTAMQQQNFVGQQLSRVWSTYGRIFLPAALYQKIGGYHATLKHYGGEDRGLLQNAVDHPGTTFISIPCEAPDPLPHSTAMRYEGMAGHKAGMTRDDHIQEARKAFQKNPVSPLPEIPVELTDQFGTRVVTLSHAGMTP